MSVDEHVRIRPWRKLYVSLLSSGEVIDLSDQALLLFVLLIASQDDTGYIPWNKGKIRQLTLPRREWTFDQTTSYAQELCDANLAIWEDEGLTLINGKYYNGKLRKERGDMVYPRYTTDRPVTPTGTPRYTTEHNLENDSEVNTQKTPDVPLVDQRTTKVDQWSTVVSVEEKRKDKNRGEEKRDDGANAKDLVNLSVSLDDSATEHSVAESPAVESPTSKAEGEEKENSAKEKEVVVPKEPMSEEARWLFGYLKDSDIPMLEAKFPLVDLAWEALRCVLDWRKKNKQMKDPRACFVNWLDAGERFRLRDHVNGNETVESENEKWAAMAAKWNKESPNG